MKHQQGKIKREHHTLKEFDKLFKQLEKIKEIQRIIPWRISRKQQWTSKQHATLSYTTPSWCKINCKKWWTAQEVFLTYWKEYHKTIQQKLHELWIQ